MTAEAYGPRGIGNGTFPCLVCKAPPPVYVQDDMAAFVRGRAGGLRVQAMFVDAGLEATLDYRPSEPTWVQVKVGACPAHRFVLENLLRLTANTHQITPEIIVAALAPGSAA